MPTEKAVVFEFKGSRLFGILHMPDNFRGQGIFMVVGGPQYRVGSHRQFVEFARAQCDQGYAVFRFDYRGMGDSEGPYLRFRDAFDDVPHAMTVFLQQVPEIKELFWFGLCDGAAASMMYVPQDPVIKGMMLMNPWVRNTRTEAQTVVKSYYRQRFLSGAFWKKLFSGKADVFGSIRDLFSNVKKSVAAPAPSEEVHFTARMLAGVKRFNRPILMVLSGNDFTADEFKLMVKESAEWQQLTSSPNWTQKGIPDANHTFSNSRWKRQVIEMCTEWMQNH